MKFDKRIVAWYGIWTVFLVAMAAYDAIIHQWALFAVMLCLIAFNVWSAIPSITQLVKGKNNG